MEKFSINEICDIALETALTEAIFCPELEDLKLDKGPDPVMNYFLDTTDMVLKGDLPAWKFLYKILPNALKSEYRRVVIQESQRQCVIAINKFLQKYDPMESEIEGLKDIPCIDIYS